MPDVFISYKREERARVERLAAALARLKFDVWFDAELQPGATFLSEINHALSASRCVIVCWTPAAARSMHVLGEAEQARSMGKLIATFFTQCVLPAPFNMIHAEDLGTWNGDVSDGLMPWRKVLGGVSSLVRRPGLIEFLDYSAAHDPVALRRWATENWKDPLAPEALELARRIEAGDAHVTASAAPRQRAAAETSAEQGPAASARDTVAHLGPRAQQAAMADDGGEALVNLGRDYLQGFGAPKDAEAARVLFEAAAGKGASAAYFNLGLMYLKGHGVVEDSATARRHFEEAASRGITEAMTNLGLIFERGLGVPRDFAKAFAYYERAAAAGDDDAIANLAVLHASGRGVRQDWTEARRLFEKAAHMGNTHALDNLGTIYAQGHGVVPNLELARRCYEAAAKAGEVSAIYNLGVYHLEGKAGEQDLSAARDCFERAAHFNHASAIANLAAMYAQGYGVTPDLHKAVGFFERAAELGATSALVNLGRIRSDPSLELFDLAAARSHFNQACDRGDEQGCFQFARMLAAGEGGPRDRKAAVEILRRLARQSTDPVARDLAAEELENLR